MKLRVTFLLTALALGGSTLTLATKAAAQQVSDADRKAARDLFNDGATAQSAGHYAEALDKFQKSIAVYPAPTTALRIAQCKASLNRLVEATEDYRAIINTALPPGSPPAYQQAKDQAQIELTALDPQVPRIKIFVLPERIQGLQVAVDGQPMNVALLGVARPIDPGNHRVTVSAPGYQTGEATVATVAKSVQIPEVRITLRVAENGGYVDPNAGNTGNTGNTGNGTGNTWNGGGTTWNPPSGGGSTGNGSTWTPPTEPRKQDTQLGIMVGGQVGYAGLVGGGGGSFSGGGTDRQSFSDMYNGSIGFGLDAGLRFARNFYVGPTFRYDILSPKNVPDIGSTWQLGVMLAWLGKSDGFGFYAEVGGAYKVASGTYNGNATYAVTGYDVLFGLGLHFRAGPIHVIPKFTLGFGKFGSGTDSVANGPYQGTLFDEGLNVSYFAGIQGFYDIPLGK